LKKNIKTSGMPYSQEVQRAIAISQALAKEYRNECYGPAHLLQAILHNDVGLVSWLGANNKDYHFMREWAAIRLEAYPKTGRTPESPVGDSQVAAVLDMADLIAMQLNLDYTEPVCILAALVRPGVAFTADHLKTFPSTQKEIMDAAAVMGTQEARGAGEAHKITTAPNNVLYKYCVDKTAMAEEGRLDPIIGRDRELRMMLEVLGRRTKPNVIITGEPGVGKTALIEGFARLIIEKKVPAHLLSCRLFELDMGALVAGASYKGEVEERMKQIIREIKAFEKAILFIDEIHMLLDSKGSMGTGVANLLKPELARGELTLIGATTNDEYRKYIESDEAFSRRFDVVRVEEPDVPGAVAMIKHILPFYERHHQLQAEHDAVMEAVTLARRYCRDRRLPDAAVDLIDRTMAAIRLMDDVSVNVLEEMIHRLDDAGMDGKGLDRRELEDRISPILLGRLQEGGGTDENSLSTLKRLKEFATEKKVSVAAADIAAIISHKTGIPMGKLKNGEREKLLHVGEELKKRVIGQDHAIRAVSEAILESRSGLLKAGAPIASFFLLGPTGTGKTELAKTLADFLFDDESALIRLDMSEFKEEHSAALLMGAPPGYVGYEEGGLLVNKIRQKPYAVLLFDEIEKAHPSVFDIFLQILDEGKLHDRLGKEGDFSNAMILFTSNIGSEFITSKFLAGTMPTNTDMLETMSGYFRPEFLARLTEIVPFAPISEDNAVRIFDIHLHSLTEPLHKQGITLTITPAAGRYLALSGFTPKYGARQIKSVIRNQLRRPISRMIISHRIAKGNTVEVRLKDDELEWIVV